MAETKGVGACQSGVGLRVGSQNGGQKTRKAAFESGLDERNENDPYCIKEAVRGYLAPGGQRQRGLAGEALLMKLILQIAPNTLFDQDLREESLNIDEDDFYVYL